MSNANVWSFPSNDTNATDLWKIETSPEEFVQLTHSNSKRWNFPTQNSICATALPNVSDLSLKQAKTQKFNSPPTALQVVPAPAPAVAAAAAPTSGKFAHNSLNIEEEITGQNLYKTELCRSFEETGTCRYGSKCQFAHGRSELRPVLRHPKYKTEVCKTFHTIGTCPYGKRCRFIHTTAELPLSTPTSSTANNNTTSNLSDISDSDSSEVIGDTNNIVPSAAVVTAIPSSLKISSVPLAQKEQPQQQQQQKTAFTATIPQVMPSFSNTGVTDVNLARVLKSNTADWSTSWNSTPATAASNTTNFTSVARNNPLNTNNAATAVLASKAINQIKQKQPDNKLQSNSENDVEERRLAIFKKICDC